MAATHGSRSPGFRYAPRNATNCTTMISGPGVVSARPSPRTISPGPQPAVGLHRPLRDVRQHGVGAAERHQRGTREEQALGRRRAAATGPGDDEGHRDPPDQQPHEQHQAGTPARGPLVVQCVVGHERRRTLVVGRVRRHRAGPVAAEQPATPRRPPARPAGTARRTGPARRTRRPRWPPAPGARGHDGRPGRRPGRRSRARPARCRRRRRPPASSYRRRRRPPTARTVPGPPAARTACPRPVRPGPR